jgi:drug/metabolite transporter (DMT)-like permease
MASRGATPVIWESSILAIAWLWIPITIGAALAQTFRNATQRSLTGDLGMLGATLIRFLYGLPFALLWLVVLLRITGASLPRLSFSFVAWTLIGAVAQIAATAFLLRVMAMRNFAIGAAYSKTEVVQVAIFGILILGEVPSIVAAFAIALATLGVVILAAPEDARRLKTWFSPSAIYGLASGAAFAISAVGYRAGALSLEAPALIAAASTLAFAQFTQTIMLGGYLLLRQPAVVAAVFRTWRISVVAGFLGALASAGWFTAFALEPVAHVRTLGLIELLFSYAVSRRIFREHLARKELIGFALLALGLIGVTLSP